MSENLVGNIILAWGLTGCLGVAGCYLIVASIVGQFIEVPPIIKVRLRVSRKPQRVLLGFFGLILAFPVLFTAWKDVFKGYQTPLVAPQIKEEVKPNEQTGASPSQKLSFRDDHRDDRGGRFQTVGWGQSPEPASLVTPAKFSPFGRPQAGRCEKVESFGLEQYHLRSLKYAQFQGGVYLYVGDIRTFGDTDLYLTFGKRGFLPEAGEMSESEFIEKVGSNKKQHLSVNHSGTSTDFEYRGIEYRLTVTDIYTAIFG